MKKTTSYTKEDIINTLHNDFYFFIGINSKPATTAMAAGTIQEQNAYANYIRGLLAELNAIEPQED